MARRFGRHRVTGIWLRRELQTKWVGNSKHFRQVLELSMPGPGVAAVANFVSKTSSGQETQVMSVMAQTDLVVLQPQPRHGALTAAERRAGASGSHHFCDCHLLEEETTLGQRGRPNYTGFEGGKCAAYDRSPLLPALDPEDQPPAFTNIGMVFANDSHLVQIPDEVSFDDETFRFNARPTLSKSWVVYFQRHLFRILSALTDGRGVENFWMIDYRLKYVDFETTTFQPTTPLEDRQTFKTRDFELVELLPEDIPEIDRVRSVAPSFQAEGISRGHDTHALGAVARLLRWQQNIVGRGGLNCPNLNTRFRVLGVLVREPRGAGWQRGPSGGNVYFGDA